jgi:hypothetical protein
VDAPRRLVAGADADRARFERELHDGVQQDLVAIVVKLQLARRLVESDPASALLDEIRADAQAALDATRKLALRIHPPMLDSAGVRVALQASAPQATVDVAVGEPCPGAVIACAYFCCLDLASAASTITLHSGGDSVAFAVEVRGTPDLSRVDDRVRAFGGRLDSVPGRVSGVLPF